MSQLSTNLPQWRAPLIPVAVPVEEPRQFPPQPRSFHWAHRSGMRLPSRCPPAPPYHRDA